MSRPVTLKARSNWYNPDDDDPAAYPGASAPTPTGRGPGGRPAPFSMHGASNQEGSSPMAAPSPTGRAGAARPAPFSMHAAKQEGSSPMSAPSPTGRAGGARPAPFSMHAAKQEDVSPMAAPSPTARGGGTARMAPFGMHTARQAPEEPPPIAAPSPKGRPASRGAPFGGMAPFAHLQAAPPSPTASSGAGVGGAGAGMQRATTPQLQATPPSPTGVTTSGGPGVSTTVTTKTSTDAQGRTIITKTTVVKTTTATGSRTETHTETTTLPRGVTSLTPEMEAQLNSPAAGGGGGSASVSPDRRITTPRAPTPPPGAAAKPWDSVPDSPPTPATPAHIARRISGGGSGGGASASTPGAKSATPSPPPGAGASAGAGAASSRPQSTRPSPAAKPPTPPPAAPGANPLRSSWAGGLGSPDPAPSPRPGSVAGARQVSASADGGPPGAAGKKPPSIITNNLWSNPAADGGAARPAPKIVIPQSPAGGGQSPGGASLLQKMAAQTLDGGLNAAPALAGPPGASLRRTPSFSKTSGAAAATAAAVAGTPTGARTSGSGSGAAGQQSLLATAGKAPSPQPPAAPKTSSSSGSGAGAGAGAATPKGGNSALAPTPRPPIGLAITPPSPSGTGKAPSSSASSAYGGAGAMPPTPSGSRRNAGWCAVSLAFLRRFREKILRERSDALSVPTFKVVYEIIKPMTEPHQCRLTDYPDKGFIAAADVGKPEYFISHAWSMPFLSLLDAVFNHLQGAMDSLHVWLDIFAVNQHPGAEQKDDLNNLRTAIDLSQATLVVLDSAGTPLERVWCLYEFDNTLELKGADGLVLMTPGFSVREVASIFRSIDVDNAKATVASDKAMILADIVKRHGSTQAFNTKLKLRFLLDPLDMKPDMTAMAARAGPDPQQWNFAPVSSWLSQAGAPQVALLAAQAGTGKSTVSAVMCLGAEYAASLSAAAAAAPATGASARPGSAMRPTTAAVGSRPGGGAGGAGSGPKVHAYHFCAYGDARRQDPVRIVKTLAYQLAHALPVLQPYYCGLDPDQLMQLNEPDTACRELLTQPLQKFCRGQQVLLLLDALDEADKPTPSGHTSHTSHTSHTASALDNKALQLLLHQLSLLPPSVRVLTTLRPEPHLLEPIRSRFPRLHELSLASLRRPDKTAAAMQARLVERFGKETAEKLLAAAGRDTVGGGSSLVYYPVVLLLKAPLKQIPTHVHDAYAAVFEQLWPSGSAGQQVQQVLEVLVAAQEPPPLSLLANLKLTGAVASLPGWGVLFFERDHHVHMLHRTVKDWLQDPSAAGKRHADARRGHRTLGRHLLLDAPRPLSTYGARYLVTHLIQAGSEPALLDKALLDTGYLEQACRQGNVFALHAELASLPEQRQTDVVRDVVRWLGLNGHVLWSHPAAVAQLAAEAPRGSGIAQAAVGGKSDTRTSASGGGGRGGGKKRGAPELLNAPSSWPVEVMALTQHPAPVADVAYSPDGELMVSVCQSARGTVRLWSATTGEPKAVLDAPAAHCLAYSPSGHLMATGGAEGAMQLWDPTTGVQRAAMQQHKNTVTVLAFSVDGSSLASGSKDKTVRLWATFNGTQRAELKGHTGTVVALAWCPDGTLLASAATADCVIRLWDSGGSLRCACEGHRQPIHSLAYSPSGSILASGSEDYTVRLWDGETGAPRCSLTDHIFPVQAVAFSPDGRSLASADSSHTVRLWDLASSPKAPAKPATPKGGPRGFMMATGGGGGPRQSMMMEVERSGGQLTAMAFSPCSTMLATGSAEGEMHVFDTQGGNVSTVRAAHAGAIRRLSFSPDSRSLVSASDDHTLRLWDPHSAARGQGSSGGPGGGGAVCAWAVHYTRGGKVVAVLGDDGSLSLWDAGAAKIMTAPQRMQGAAQPVCSRVSPDEGSLAVGEADGTVRLWDLGSGRLRARLKGHSGIVKGLAFSSDSAVLASASDDSRVILWQVDNGKTLASLKNDVGATSIALEAGGRLLAAGGEDGKVRVWNVTNVGSVLPKAIVMSGHKGPVLSVAFKPTGSGNVLASGGSDASVRVWDAASGAETCLLQGHREGVCKLTWAKGGRFLASASRGQGTVGSVFVWEVQSRTQIWSSAASDMCVTAGSGELPSGGVAVVVSTIPHAPHLTIVCEGPGRSDAPPAPGAGNSDTVVVADGLLELRQVPVYTSFATPAAVGFHRSSLVMAFGGAINFYRY